MGRKISSKVDRWLEKDNLFLLQCWCRDGLRNVDIAERIGINPKTLYEWKKRYPEIEDALSKGKEVIDYEVENALLKSALGYSTVETRTLINGKPDKDGNRNVRVETIEKEYPPNVTAIAMWLNNRKPDDWKRNRDNIESLTDENNSITVNIVKHNPNKKKEDEEEGSWEVTSTPNTTKNNKERNTVKGNKKEVVDLDEWPDDWEE